MRVSNYDDFVSGWACQTITKLFLYDRVKLGPHRFWMKESNYNGVVSGWASQTMVTLFLDERVKL